MQMDVQDLFDINYSRNMRYDTLFFLINRHISILVDLSCMIFTMILALWLALAAIVKRHQIVGSVF
jgi:hypothetical protein